MENLTSKPVSIHHDEQWLHVSFDDGTSERFFGQWLRDNAPSGRHQAGGQRTFDVNTMPVPSITNAQLTDGSVVVTFDHDLPVQTFPSTWLEANRHSASKPDHILWDGTLQDSLQFFDFQSIQANDVELLAWLRQVRNFGFGLLENVPTSQDTILDVVNLFGFVRETNYGTTFAVREEADPSNLAFTKASIGMHTDNPYRDPVPGLQLLHCLINESDGGETQLSDGFAIVDQLRRTHPEEVALLERQPVTFRYFEDGQADLQASFPLIETDALGRTTGVRYNSRSIQAFSLPSDKMQSFYEAYRVLGQALQDQAARIEFRLGPGQLMMFDNKRVLHGRSGYKVGARHLQGCYADKDSLNSKIRVLSQQPDRPTDRD